MSAFWDSLHQFTLLSVVLRLVLAVVMGGTLGLNRTQKRRAAGFRTYMLICLGAALTVMTNQYLAEMLGGLWHPAVESIPNVHTDVSRLGAKVLNGISFLSACTVLVTGRQEVKGLTTAAGLWAAACLGLAVGAGFFEGALITFALLLFAIRALPSLEAVVLEYGRNIEIYAEFTSMEDVGEIISRIQKQDARIYEVDVNRASDHPGSRPSAVFSIRLRERCAHSKVLAAISEFDHITLIDEV